ncbi:crotonase/enoyl-CoA hydratase family protein [Salicibibacter cibi]|nr:crotonase/enoyl-CoA hydratase family protein [Salicibibacter cibi]
MDETIKVDVSNKIMTITLNRPDKLNAYNRQMQNDFMHALDRADSDDEVRVVIVTGEGRAFCAGADLEKGGETFGFEDSIEEHRDGGGILALRIYELKKPIIAAINGPAVGIGATMTLPMDVRIASDKAKMGFVFARRGITQEACSGWFLPRIVGISQAMEWVSTGRIFKAEEALETGLVSKVVPPEELMDTAVSLGREIADNTSAISVALSRQLMWKMMGADHPMEAHKIESKYLYWVGKREDAREGINSFLEKREPNFNMKPSTDMPEFYPWWEERTFKS